MIDELEPLLRAFGDLELLQWTVYESSFAALAAAGWDAAERRIREAVDINHRAGPALHDSWFLAELGAVARRRGRFEQAVRLGREALAVARRSPHRWFGPVAAAHLGTTLIELRKTAAAADVPTSAGTEAYRDGAEATCCAAWRRWPKLSDRIDRDPRRSRRTAQGDQRPARLGVAARLGRVPVPRSCWLDQRCPARSKLILAPLIDAPRDATARLPLWWRLVLSRLQRWPRWASRQHHMPSQKPSPSHPAAACRAWSAVRGPCSRRCNSDCWDGDTWPCAAATRDSRRQPPETPTKCQSFATEDR